MSLKLKWSLFIVVDLALALVLVWLFLLREDLDQVQALRDVGATVYPEAKAITPFQLHDQYGTAFTEDDLTGRWSLVFFGFTNCPDVCPLTMAELGEFYSQLPEASDQPVPQVIMATVDPQRDDGAELTRFLNQFHPDFIGLTGPDSALANLAGQLYVVRDTIADSMAGHGEMTHGDDASVPTPIEAPIDHSGHISVINPDGELYAVMRLPHRRETLITAYEMIVENWQ